MIIEVLHAIFMFSTALMVAYLVRHYIFTLTVLRRTKKAKRPRSPKDNSGNS